MSCMICPLSGAKVCSGDHCGLCFAETDEELMVILLGGRA